MDRIATDHAGAAREVARLLHAAGHRRFLCVGGPPWASVNRERADGFLGELAALETAEVAQVTAGPSYAGGREAFGAHVQARGAPDAVFCVNDALALGVLDACRFDLGLVAPADISVVGFDDVAEAAHQSYNLTTVRQDVDAMAAGAVEPAASAVRSPGRAGTARAAAGHRNPPRFGTDLMWSYAAAAVPVAASNRNRWSRLMRSPTCSPDAETHVPVTARGDPDAVDIGGDQDCLTGQLERVDGTFRIAGAGGDQVHVLGPYAQHHGRVAAASDAVQPDAGAVNTPSSSAPDSRFIGGEPMNPATNRLAGSL